MLKTTAVTRAKTMKRIMSLVLAVILMTGVLAGAALIVYAVHAWKQAAKEDQQQPRDDRNDIK